MHRFTRHIPTFQSQHTLSYLFSTHDKHRSFIDPKTLPPVFKGPSPLFNFSNTHIVPKIRIPTLTQMTYTLERPTQNESNEAYTNRVSQQKKYTIHEIIDVIKERWQQSSSQSDTKNEAGNVIGLYKNPKNNTVERYWVKFLPSHLAQGEFLAPNAISAWGYDKTATEPTPSDFIIKTGALPLSSLPSLSTNEFKNHIAIVRRWVNAETSATLFKAHGEAVCNVLRVITSPQNEDDSLYQKMKQLIPQLIENRFSSNLVKQELHLLHTTRLDYAASTINDFSAGLTQCLDTVLAHPSLTKEDKLQLQDTKEKVKTLTTLHLVSLEPNTDSFDTYISKANTIKEEVYTPDLGGFYDHTALAFYNTENNPVIHDIRVLSALASPAIFGAHTISDEELVGLYHVRFNGFCDIDHNNPNHLLVPDPNNPSSVHHKSALFDFDGFGADMNWAHYYEDMESKQIHFNSDYPPGTLKWKYHNIIKCGNDPMLFFEITLWEHNHLAGTLVRRNAAPIEKLAEIHMPKAWFLKGLERYPDQLSIAKSAQYSANVIDERHHNIHLTHDMERRIVDETKQTPNLFSIITGCDLTAWTTQRLLKPWLPDVYRTVSEEINRQ